MVAGTTPAQNKIEKAKKMNLPVLKLEELFEMINRFTKNAPKSNVDHDPFSIEEVPFSLGENSLINEEENKQKSDLNEDDYIKFL